MVLTQMHKSMFNHTLYCFHGNCNVVETPCNVSSFSNSQICATTYFKFLTLTIYRVGIVLRTNVKERK